MQYLRARYYDAATGRFGVQDSYLGDLSDPLTLNRYLYCLADPLNLIDPTGHASRRSYTSGRLGSTYSPAYGKRTLVNRSGNRNSVQARYEQQGKKNLNYVLSGGLLRSLTANKVINYQFNYINALNSGNRSSANDWYRRALAAQQELLRYCNGDMAKMSSYIETAIKNRAGLHLLLDIGGLLTGVSDVINAKIYYVEGDTGNGNMSLASAVPILGWGATATKYAKKGAHIANAAEAINDTRKAFEHTSPSKLERNMKASGILTPAYAYNAHHIVAKGDSRAEPARKILANYGIDIDDAINGVFLPVGKEVMEGTNHWGLHTNEYYNTINKSLEGAASKEQAIKALEEIGASLANGTFK